MRTKSETLLVEQTENNLQFIPHSVDLLDYAHSFKTNLFEICAYDAVRKATLLGRHTSAVIVTFRRGRRQSFMPDQARSSAPQPSPPFRQSLAPHHSHSGPHHH